MEAILLQDSFKNMFPFRSYPNEFNEKPLLCDRNGLQSHGVINTSMAAESLSRQVKQLWFLQSGLSTLLWQHTRSYIALCKIGGKVATVSNNTAQKNVAHKVQLVQSNIFISHKSRSIFASLFIGSGCTWGIETRCSEGQIHWVTVFERWMTPEDKYFIESHTMPNTIRH